MKKAVKRSVILLLLLSLTAALFGYTPEAPVSSAPTAESAVCTGLSLQQAGLDTTLPKSVSAVDGFTAQLWWEHGDDAKSLQAALGESASWITRLSVDPNGGWSLAKIVTTDTEVSGVPVLLVQALRKTDIDAGLPVRYPAPFRYDALLGEETAVLQPSAAELLDARVAETEEYYLVDLFALLGLDYDMVSCQAAVYLADNGVSTEEAPLTVDFFTYLRNCRAAHAALAEGLALQ